MKGYTYEEVINLKDLAIYQYALRYSLLIEDRHDDRYRCHEIARAVASILRAKFPFNEYPYDLKVIDGNYAGVEHSWITLRTIAEGPHAGGQIILDPYAVGRFPMMQIVLLSPNNLERLYYKPDECARSDIKIADVIVLSEVSSA